MIDTSDHTTLVRGEMPSEAVSYVMKVSGNGQVSIPAEARSRWRTSRVVVVDFGDRIVMRPLADDPVGALRGKYAGRGPDSRAARRSTRATQQEVERRRRRA